MSSESFRQAAQAYCSWVEEGAGQIVEPAELAGLLARLYVAALELPDVEPVGGPEDEPPVPQQPDAPLVGNQAYYWESLDPFDEGRPGIASLCDDVLDIYADLKGPLAKLAQDPSWPDAVWCWRFSFRSHWGDHLTSALRAIHRLVTNPEAEFTVREGTDQG